MTGERNTIVKPRRVASGLVHALPALWLIGNIWLAKPYHENVLGTFILAWAIFLINPIMFGYLGWRNTSGRSLRYGGGWAFAALVS